MSDVEKKSKSSVIVRGTVVSVKGSTVKVSVRRVLKHRMYKKTVSKVFSYIAHDPVGNCKLGDFVALSSCAPVSKRKKVNCFGVWLVSCAGVFVMIIENSKLKVADNSGALSVQCIRVLGSAGFASVGSEIVVVVKKALPSSTKVKKGQVVRAVVVSTVSRLSRADGSFIRFDGNYVVIIDKDGNPIGSRVVVPVCRELRNKYMKLISLAPEVL